LDRFGNYWFTISGVGDIAAVKFKQVPLPAEFRSLRLNVAMQSNYFLASGGVCFNKTLGSFGNLAMKFGISQFLRRLPLKIPFGLFGQSFVFVVSTSRDNENDDGRDYDQDRLWHVASIVLGCDSEWLAGPRASGVLEPS
jgi:hypothetical protein